MSRALTEAKDAPLVIPSVARDLVGRVARGSCRPCLQVPRYARDDADPADCSKLRDQDVRDRPKHRPQSESSFALRSRTPPQHDDARNSREIVAQFIDVEVPREREIANNL